MTERSSVGLTKRGIELYERLRDALRDTPRGDRFLILTGQDLALDDEGGDADIIEGDFGNIAISSNDQLVGKTVYMCKRVP